VIRRLIVIVLLAWILGFVWFAVALPQPMDDERDGAQADAIIVPTGGPGRIERGVAVLDEGQARMMLVTGVSTQVTPDEFAAQFDVPMSLMECCITLGYDAVDTRGNARETSRWVADNDLRRLRLVTTDWHMRRAAGELERTLPDSIVILRDAVSSEPSFGMLFLEYHKLLASRGTQWMEGLG
jgi:uncharacterized SAM-binding protein YcdF (DUF218 family)